MIFVLLKTFFSPLGLCCFCNVLDAEGPHLFPAHLGLAISAAEEACVFVSQKLGADKSMTY